MSGKFFVELYEKEDGGLRYTGIAFEAGHLGGQVPVTGDCLIAPLHKAGFKAPRNPEDHYAYEVVHRYCVPEVASEPFPRFKLIVERRELTAVEHGMFSQDQTKDGTS